jgi:hypothetical protein
MRTDQIRWIVRLGSASVLTAALFVGPPALAQLGSLGTGVNGMPGSMSLGGAREQQPAQPKMQPPPALPGSKLNAPSAAPATQAPSDMLPTDALFDAINRGDVAAARDAISRGADLSGRNVLGMTPMELSVDLGRNDISFLLLSMRAEDHRPASPASGQGGQSGGVPATRVKVARRPPAVPAKAAQPVQRTPRLFANDGGAPVQSVGFLGFDPVRTR